MMSVWEEQEKRLWAKPPRCLSGFPLVSTAPRHAHPDGFVIAFRLICSCGTDRGQLLGHSLASLYSGGREISDLFAGPLAYGCALCRRVTEILDTELHGYNPESGFSSANAFGQGPRQVFSCPKCASTLFEITVELEYGAGVLDLEDDCPDIAERLEDFFDFFFALCRCCTCGETIIAAEFELA